jgi:hypothetical protein
MLRKLGRPESVKYSLQTFLIVVGFCAVLLIVFVQPLDGDTWWHLRTGEETFEQKKPLSIDIYSYTRFGEPYISHSWLTDLFLYLIYKGFGFPGLSIWIGVLAIIALFLVYIQMEGPGIFRITLVLIAAILLLPFLKARPQMISIAFLLGISWILGAFYKDKRDYLFWLIPIFILWSNLHGGFIIGIIYLILFIITDYLEGFTRGGRVSVLIRGKRKRLQIVFLLCLVAVMIHPMGFTVWSTLINTMNSSTDSNMIIEWASPDFHDPSQQVYLWWLLVILVILSLSKRRPKIIEVLSLVMFTAMGFIWRRHLSFLIVFGVIIVSKPLWKIISSGSIKLKTRVGARFSSLVSLLLELLDSPTPSILRLTFLLITAVVFTSSLVKLYIITTPKHIESVEQQLFPYAAKTWIEQNHLEGNMLNSYNWGGYFDWYLRDYPVFIDSRADLFGDEIIGQWLDVMNARGDWRAIIDHWKVNFIVIEPGWRIVDILPFYGWEELYRDDQAVIFGRASYHPTQR